MVIILVCFLLTTLIFYSFGYKFLLITDKKNYETYNFFDSFFIGLCTVGAILNIWSLLLPTNGTALLLLIVAAVLIIVFTKNIKQQIINFRFEYKKLFLLFLILLLPIILLYSIQEPLHFDTYLYHINAIQWAEQYPVVPGLVNIHERFGFNSSMFILSAGFLFNGIFSQYIFIINSLAMLVFCTWILWLISTQTVSRLISLFLIVFLYLFAQQYIPYISSPNSDILVNILISYILINLLVSSTSINSKSIIYTVLPLYCITLKISIIPVILISFYCIYITNKNLYKAILKSLLYSSFFILPWIIRNIIITGYIIYPLNEVDLFSFEWKIPVEKVKIMKNRIYAWARDYTQDYSLVMGMSFTEWFKIWWSRVDFINKVLFVLSAISPLILITSLKKLKLQLIVFFIISYICFLLWLQAPDFRFSFGFILFLGLSSLLLIAQWFKTKYQLKSNSIVIFTFILVLSLHIQAYPYYRAFFYNNLYSRLYKPVDISAIKFKKSVRFKKKTYITPNNKEQVMYGFYAEAPCYDQFPCSPELDNFRMRGDDLKDGFLPAD